MADSGISSPRLSVRTGGGVDGGQAERILQ